MIITLVLCIIGYVIYHFGKPEKVTKDSDIFRKRVYMRRYISNAFIECPIMSQERLINKSTSVYTYGKYTIYNDSTENTTYYIKYEGLPLTDGDKALIENEIATYKLVMEIN